MNFKELTLASFAAALALSTGCVTDDDPAGDTDGTDTATTMTVTDTTPTGPTGPTGPSTGPTTTDPDTTDTDPTGDTDTDTGDTDTDTDTDGINPDFYNFREDEADLYTRVDRSGFPAINTALIAAENKDAYNAGSPADDVTGTFAPDAVGTLQFLHSTPTEGTPPVPVPGEVGLDDDIFLANTWLGTSLTPCGAFAGNDNCVEQVVPLAFPDVLLLNTAEPTGFPNGRTLDVPVIDVILAAILIEVTVPTDLFVFTDLDPTDDDVNGLSQSPNDGEFPGAFPYLAPAWE